METKNVTFEKTFEIPVIVTTEKTITVPDFSQMVHAINNNAQREKEAYEIYNRQIKSSSESMLEQLGTYFEALLLPLDSKTFEGNNLLDVLCSKGTIFACYNGVGVKISSYDYVRRYDGVFCEGLCIKIGTGNGCYDFNGYLKFELPFGCEKISIPKYNINMNSVLSAFSRNWDKIKKSLETNIENKLKAYQERYEKETLRSYNQLSDITNFEI